MDIKYTTSHVKGGDLYPEVSQEQGFKLIAVRIANFIA
jgi:hypothetical protein